MVVVMNADAEADEIERVKWNLEQMLFRTQVIYGVKRIVIGAIGDQREVDLSEIEQMPKVDKIVRISKPYKLVSREVKEDDTVITIKNASIGSGTPVIIAGPCAVESQEQILAAASWVKKSGAHMLRGGAFKPRTSPYSFQGMGEEGLKLLQEASLQTGLPVVTEVIGEWSLETALKYVDVLQIGARNMQNFQLLKKAGQTRVPVLLKRGMSATVEEWLMAAEYIRSEGNENIILCERGIRTFETATRNTLDLSAVPLIKRLSHLPVLVDPSHATGDRGLVIPMALAAIAGGADGLIIEMHPEPAKALSDGPQSLDPQQFEQLMQRVNRLIPLVGAK
jgi:3-deoxy-7-phosphoheptulonate synthase